MNEIKVLWLDDESEEFLANEDWRAQFVGTSGNLKVSKDGGTVDALTGATVTSRTITEAVNRAVEFVKEVQP